MSTQSFTENTNWCWQEKVEVSGSGKTCPWCCLEVPDPGTLELLTKNYHLEISGCKNLQRGCLFINGVVNRGALSSYIATRSKLPVRGY